MSESQVTSVEHGPSAVVVRVKARNLGKTEVDGICRDTDEARLTEPSSPFIVDMTHVDFAGSLAIGVLVGLNQEFRNRGQRLIFVSLQSNLRQAFAITRINQFLELMQDVPTALQSVQGVT